MTGKKSIETRSYPLPEVLLNKIIWIIESPEGKPKKSALPDTVPIGTHKLKIKGYVIFEKNVKYASKKEFDLDFEKHMVPSDSKYGKWTEENPIYGWHVKSFVKIEKEVERVPKLTRIFHSLFTIGIKFIFMT